MANTFKVLYQGQLGTTATTLTTVGALKTWIIKHMTAVNNDTTAARTFGLYVGGTTGTKIITAPAISIPSLGSWEWIPCDITLEAAQTVAGSASAASQVTLTIFGDELS